jgi:very-short-patch-repair endonuclease
MPMLPPNWVWNFPVALGGRQLGYPTNYKLDFAWPKKKVGLEVNGSSHRTALGQQRDAKKTAKLQELGWTVLSIWNHEVENTSITSKLTEHLTTLLGPDT